ncbi:FAD-dependent oxidoreductase [Pseudonocardia eucalypti]|uniref:D-amino-acid oxidase n=1 Tax=Pseudonocardia eucalypti TaxID=648755 RepID=A0ABP9PKP0_9PSEU|nr:D-amino-acid oxidase [Pseudonocardia eucalypti]
MRVTVLGAGVSGLSTAVSLLRAGAGVRVVAAGPVRESTSYLAAAVWFPTHVGPAGAVARWGAHAYRVFAEQAACGVPGVVMRESMALYRQPPGEPEWAEQVGGVRPAEPAELPAGYPHGLRYVVPLVEMPRYLPWLAGELTRLGGELVTRRVGDLAELAGLGTDAVVNCTGLAARELVGDDSVYPVRGQIVRVTNPGLTLSVRDEGHPEGRAYVHPRERDAVLGGTLEEHRWDTEPDPATGESILRRCRDLAPELAGAQVLEHIAGLRPGRPEVRLAEGEPVGDTRVIHNYGHGGAGITLSWGCAADVVSLLAR